MKEYEKLAIQYFNKGVIENIPPSIKNYDDGFCAGLEDGFINGFLKAREMAIDIVVDTEVPFHQAVIDLEKLGEKEV